MKINQFILSLMNASNVQSPNLMKHNSFNTYTILKVKI